MVAVFSLSSDNIQVTAMVFVKGQEDSTWFLLRQDTWDLFHWNGPVEQMACHSVGTNRCVSLALPNPAGFQQNQSNNIACHSDVANPAMALRIKLYCQVFWMLRDSMHLPRRSQDPSSGRERTAPDGHYHDFPQIKRISEVFANVAARSQGDSQPKVWVCCLCQLCRVLWLRKDYLC